MRLINADELKTILSEEITRRFVRWDKTITVAEWETFTRDVIDNAPTVEPFAEVHFETFREYERPHGDWITDDNRNVVCSYCGGIRRDCRIDHIEFCNRCGADMKGGAE